MHKITAQSAQVDRPSALQSTGGNRLYFRGGEMPGFNSFVGYDPANKMTLVIRTNLTVSLDAEPTANALMLKVLESDLRAVAASISAA